MLSFTLPALTAVLAAASALGASVSASASTKKDEGVVLGQKPGVFYLWNLTSTDLSCNSLTTANLNTSLVELEGIFPHNYDAVSKDQTDLGVGALYLSYPEGTYAFYVSDTLVSPNSTATWIDNGADISNVFDAMRKDMVKIWGEKRTFQFAHYNVTKVTKGIAKHAATFWFQAQTPSFVKGCDTRCGGGCHPQCTTCT